MSNTMESVRFLFTGPVILGFLVILNAMTSPGHWWVKWPALGIGLAWVFSLLRVLRLLVLVGGATALIAYLRRRWSR